MNALKATRERDVWKVMISYAEEQDTSSIDQIVLLRRTSFFKRNPLNYREKRAT